MLSLVSQVKSYSSFCLLMEENFTDYSLLEKKKLLQPGPQNFLSTALICGLHFLSACQKLILSNKYSPPFTFFLEIILHICMVLCMAKGKSLKHIRV